MAASLIAQVAVSVASFSVDRPYSYLVPQPLRYDIKPGVRVIVPFGRGNKKIEGIVLSVKTGERERELKAIERCLDLEPVLSEEMLRLAMWLRDRFFCTVYSAVHAMLPAGMWFKDGERKVKDKVISIAVLEVSGEEAMEAAAQKKLKAPMQSAVLELLASIGSAATKEISYFTGASAQTIKSLEKQELISIRQQEAFRRPEYTASESADPIVLNREQQDAFDGLLQLLNQNRAEAALLYGITGSGKTSVYIRLIEEAVKSGKSAIVLVPEIGLTPQFVSIFSAHFGDKIAVLHSSLSLAERYDEWKRINNGSVDVVIGTRSAIFAPLNNLGLIIMDEEQEYTYKSENSPRYHTRDVAKFRCVYNDALFLMGSATPDVDTMYNAKIGKYKLFELKYRYNERDLPNVLIADMKQELKSGNMTTISSVLYEELKKNIDNGEQSILFINRRGASNLTVCSECGYTYTCPNCSVSMKYHSANRRIMCHYCGYSEKLIEKCPECGGQLSFIGAGTQKVETELKDLFPDIEILRMDTDTVSPAHSHEKILSEFKEKKIPILVGTQMVAKGLDIENVTLVGVISADQSLYVNDYRSHERTFSMITQVIGRSGRGDKIGRAVIQTFTPNNEVIKLAAKQDYISFYEQDIQLREVLQCPPIADIYTITVFGMSEEAVLRGCSAVRASLENYLSGDSSVKILGIAPASVVKTNNKYRYKVTLSCKSSKKVRDVISHIISEFSSDSKNRGLSIYADINQID